MNVTMPPGATGFFSQNLIQPFQGSVKAAGIYHFDVRLDGKVLARIPLRVISQGELNPPAT